MRVGRPLLRRATGALIVLGASLLPLPAHAALDPVTPGTPAVRVDPPWPTVTVAASGDILLHTPVIHSAQRNAGGTGFDFRPMFARLRPVVGGADLGICHLETPVAPPGRPLSSAPIYGGPRQIAAGIASAGYDRCSTASNHTLDQGTAGIDTTLDALDAAGLAHAGSARSAREAVAPVLTYNGLRIVHLSYTYGFNGARPPASEPWRANQIDPGRIIADARDARRRGAQAVIVSLHWGTEGDSRPSVYQRQVADAVTGSGQIDLVIGHHAHVLQPIEKINGVWVIFGLGNSLSNMPTGPFPPSSQDGAVVTVELSLRRRGNVRVARPVVHPTWVDRTNGHVIRPVLTDLRDPRVSDATKAGLRQSLARTSAVLGPFISAD